MITRFDRPIVKNLRTELDELLKTFGEKHGIIVQMGNARFTANSVNWKMTMVALNSVGADDNQSLEAVQFLSNCTIYGLEKSDLNSKIILRGQPNKIVGLNPRRHKYPVICENNNGTRYVYSIQEIKQALLAKKMAAAGG